MLPTVFRLALRQIEDLLSLDIAVADHSTMSRLARAISSAIANHESGMIPLRALYRGFEILGLNYI
jgi:hypothetical protein